nr:MAG: nonstructural protein [Riboviria sp.]
MQGLITVLLSFLGGNKGARDYCLFTRDMYLETPGDIQVIDAPPPQFSQCGPSVLEFPAVMPAQTQGNAADALTSRHHEVNPLRPPALTDEHLRYIQEFTDHYCKGNLEPTTDEETLAVQRSAITTARIRDAIAEDLIRAPARANSFIKNEWYPEPKKVRNIVPVCPSHNLEGFRYDRPFKEFVLKEVPAYFPGRKPGEIVKQLEKVLSAAPPPGCIRGDCIIEGDFSNMDGTETEELRRVVFNVMRAAFHPRYHDDFDAMVDAHFA